MPFRVAQYVNEIVSLSIMSLLVVALAASEHERAGAATAVPAPVMLADRDFNFRRDGE